MVVKADKVHVRIAPKLAPGELVHAVAELHGIKAEVGDGAMRVAHAAGGVAGGMIGGVAAHVVVSKVGRAVKQGRLQGEQAGVAVHLPVRPLVVAVTTYRVLFLTMSALRCKVEAEFSPAHLTTMRLERGVQGRSALMFTFFDGSMTGRALAYADAGQRVNDVFLRLRRGELAAAPMPAKR